MEFRQLVSGLVVTAVVASSPDAAAQQIAEAYGLDAPTETRLDEEGARTRLLNWVEHERGGRSQQVYFRNTSDQPIDITSYEFFDCVNVAGVSCGKKIEGPRIEPGETIILVTVRQRDIQRRWKYRYQFQARFPDPPPATGLRNSNRTTVAAARPRTTGWIPERYEYVDRVMPMLMRNHSVPGVAIVLVDGSTVQWAAGYGIADDDDEDVTPRTVFRVGALAEPVIALALHRLSVERAWNVESPVTTWAHAETIPTGLESASAADLLSHATSIPGGSYALLQELVELSEGHDLQVLIRAMVIQPHHLTSMSFMPLASGGMARGHDRSGQPVPPAPVDDDDVSSALFSSASDYARFLVEASPLARRDPATWRRLVRPHRALADDHSLAWGLGWIVARASDSSPIAFRTGEAPGYTSFALVDETRQRALVILTNGDGGLDLTEDVLGFLDPWSGPIVEAYRQGD